MFSRHVRITSKLRLKQALESGYLKRPFTLNIIIHDDPISSVISSWRRILRLHPTLGAGCLEPAGSPTLTGAISS